VANLGISRRIAGKGRMHPKRTPQKKTNKSNLAETSSGFGSSMADEVLFTFVVSHKHQH
jgi:hypothetical protein